MDYSATNIFIKSLKFSGLKKQQIKILRGQALAGNLDGAIKGLKRLKQRGEKNE